MPWNGGRPICSLRMRVASAATAKCAELLSEDLSDGQIVQGVTVRNPFGVDHGVGGGQVEAGAAGLERPLPSMCVF